MIYEKSCGAVIYYCDRGRILYLTEKMKKGHISLCKGHVEGNETEHETAAREIREETGLEVIFRDGFRETTKYSPYAGCMKDVIFFLAEAETLDTVAQESEVSSIQWLTCEEAVRALTHQSDKDVLSKADKFIKEKRKQG